MALCGCVGGKEKEECVYVCVCVVFVCVCVACPFNMARVICTSVPGNNYSLHHRALSTLK